MSTIPTVRVKSTNKLGYQIINQADQKAHHEVLPDQEPSFTDPAGTAVADATAVEIAVRITDKLLASKLRVSPAQWVAMPLAERVEQMLLAELEIDDGIRGVQHEHSLHVDSTKMGQAGAQPATPVHGTAAEQPHAPTVDEVVGRDADSPFVPPAPAPAAPPVAPASPAAPAAAPQAPAEQPAWKTKPKGKQG